jgi:hypothetical protein
MEDNLGASASGDVQNCAVDIQAFDVVVMPQVLEVPASATSDIEKCSGVRSGRLYDPVQRTCSGSVVLEMVELVVVASRLVVHGGGGGSMERLGVRA